MSNLKRPELIAEAARRNQELLARLGEELRKSRRRRRWPQTTLAQRVGVVQSTVSQMERGRGGSLSIDAWQRAFLAVDRRLMLDASRDLDAGTTDAGHLRIQELVLQAGRRAGFSGTFELATRPADPARSADVGLRDDRRRLLVLVECWNTIGDVGAAARSTSRKLAEAAQLAVAIGGDRSHRVAGVWVIRATAANRALTSRYPEVFAVRFPGSSLAWLATLTDGAPPPQESGIVWCDVAATRLYAWRKRLTVS